MFNIQLTLEEKNVLIQLIDIAVKANGLNVANAALVLATKIQAAKPVDDTPKEAVQIPRA